MKIIEQSYEILTPIKKEESLRLIELAGRTAYKSEDKITNDSGENFVRKICENRHEAVLEHSFLSVKFITDRGVSHELVRHRLASFTQESTRYCNYSKDKFNNELAFIRPLFNSEKIDPYTAFGIWESTMFCIEMNYFYMLNCGATPQEARSILPNSLKTEIVISANFREWKHILRLRAIEKTAHPQMRQLMIPLYKELRNTLPEVFEMGDIE